MCESLDYDKIPPMVKYTGKCFYCSTVFSGEYPLQLRTARGETRAVYFCSYACLNEYALSLETKVSVAIIKRRLYQVVRDIAMSYARRLRVLIMGMSNG